jgi:hypothetical protein
MQDSLLTHQNQPASLWKVNATSHREIFARFQEDYLGIIIITKFSYSQNVSNGMKHNVINLIH